jgi:hypothetical protein
LLIQCGVADHDQPLWFSDRQHLKQKTIHYGENAGIGTDAKRQGNDGHGGETWVLAQLPRGVTEILDESIHIVVPHSHLSATMGSTLAARRAGM